ncbi:antibiotic biosynthesis monooxygenase [Alkalihalobacillus hwajinpoensis]|uniref:putative quinol monooxygenase n=1 Tax=Guptibacillus hwajinpoensis TaxID=208199 RepID=UPI00188474FA|nr:putative quinol monooxygenase [Pseudalkalibacillus hwajinpoensis]MBF0706272.1 antibiotic biosynthesis monooxygenase [Pseudalkalibacillus hwajinpoensis]
MIIIHAGLQINPAKEEEFLKEVTTLIEAARNEEGNISYTLSKEVEKENTYKMIEAYEDMAAVEAHNQSAHFQAFVGKAPEYLVAPLEVKVYDATEIQK